MTESDSSQPPESAQNLEAEELDRITQIPINRQQTLEFAGFLVREDEDSIYVADPQGTWVIRRRDVVLLEDWEPERIPDFMRNSGRPVRVGVKDGVTIHEIRPWRIHRHAGRMGARFQELLEGVFTLGGDPLPIGERTYLGERQLAALERTFARRIGWSPDYTPERDLSRGGWRAPWTPSGTQVLADGM